jgi:hypothetical protein
MSLAKENVRKLQKEKTPRDTLLRVKYDMVCTCACTLTRDFLLTCIVRNNSSSPPPSPPKQELMKDGLDADDIWVMVEDEFLATAKLYTQHLHHAEYQRLKKLARSQNASTIQSISRPVDNRTVLSMESKKKMEATVRRQQGNIAITNILGRGNLGGRNDPDSEGEDDPWMKDPRLAGLMTHRENSTQLAAITGVKSKTRASEGYSQTLRPQLQACETSFSAGSTTVVQREKPKRAEASKAVEAAEEAEPFKYDEDDEDDLDASAWKAPRPAKSVYKRINPPAHNSSAKPLGAIEKIRRKDEKLFLRSKYNGMNAKLSSPSASPRTAKTHMEISNDEQDSSDDLPERQPVSSKLAERMAKRKAESVKKEREEGRRTSLLLEEIPTFLV